MKRGLILIFLSILLGGCSILSREVKIPSANQNFEGYTPTESVIREQITPGATNPVQKEEVNDLDSEIESASKLEMQSDWSGSDLNDDQFVY